MSIPESQLETWSHQGAFSTAKTTADSIKNALTANNWPSGCDYEIYLQGSYKNDTNIRGDSDVDVVAQLNSTFYSNLNEEQKRYLGLTPATYEWQSFKIDTLNALKKYYGLNVVTEGNKSIKIAANSGRLPADVVVCAKYREYNTVNLYDYTEGMVFWTKDTSRKVVNYPKIHYENGVNKHQATNKWYKPTVRIIKNIRTFLENSQVISKTLAPSYFVECLLYNVPNNCFGISYQKALYHSADWLLKTDLTEFVCQNGKTLLFGYGPEQWSIPSAQQYIKAIVALWDNWR